MSKRDQKGDQQGDRDERDAFDLGSAADAAFDEALSSGEEQDEVLVFEMEDDDDSPSLPEGAGERTGRTAYALPPMDADEFSELGDAWEGRTDGDDLQFREGRDRRVQILLATGLGAIFAIAFFAFSKSADEELPAEPVAGLVTNDAGSKPNNAGTPKTAGNEPAPKSGFVPQEREPRSMVAGIQSLFGSSSSGSATNRSFGGVDSANPYALGVDTSGALPRERREGVVAYREQVVLPGPLPNLEYLEGTALESVWWKQELPPEGLAAALFMQTPMVGGVRVHTRNSEFFDGQLVGMGEGRIVLRTRSGALTLSGDQVALTERILDGDLDSGTLVAKTSGKGVRIHAPGGWLRGEVVQENGDKVTLLLDSGGRITVDRAAIEPAQARTRIELPDPIAGI